MARTTHVKRAQQRYKTVIVRDDDGNPKRTPVMRKDGTQKTTKKGRPVFMTVTVADKSQPLDPYTCDHCRKPIEVGSSFKHISPKSGPYGGRKLTRHEGCPSWQVWDYSSSLSAQLARIAHDFGEAIDSAEAPDDVQSALDDAASSIEEIADQKEESASNIEDGFGHETSASQELAETADSLRDWAGEITSADIPDMTECETCSGDGKVECETCGGAGQHEIEAGAGLSDCEDCEGNGDLDCEDCDGTGEDTDAWRDEVQNSVTIVDESPV